MHQMMDLFSVPEMTLFSNVVQVSHPSQRASGVVQGVVGADYVYSSTCQCLGPLFMRHPLHRDTCSALIIFNIDVL